MSDPDTLYTQFPHYAFVPPPELAAATGHVPVAIVGAGPVGLTLACLLAAHGVRTVVFETRDRVSLGSRAICISRRSLEIWARHGLAARALAKGLAWVGGRSDWRGHEVLRFDMPQEPGAQHPPMINLQQCWIEQYLVDAARESALVDLRWQSRVTGVSEQPSLVTLAVETPGGRYTLDAQYVVGADGARSTLRELLGLKLEGESYEGRYLIADIVLEQPWPVERRAWFDPPSNPGSTVLAHRQPDDVLRIDYQLRADEDDEAELQESRIRARIDAHLAMLGLPARYTLVWRSLYRAHCLSLARYRHGRALFVGDAAHLVPIFGVRGLNSGIDDAGNLAWKLACVLDGRGGDALLESYSEERVYAAQENIRHARKSTLFMSPPTAGYALMRDAALSLAVSAPFARSLVNPRQTTAITFPSSRLQTVDDAGPGPSPVPGQTLPNPRLRLRAADGSWRAGHLLELPGLDPVLIVRADHPLGDALSRPGLDVLRVSPADSAAAIAWDADGEALAALGLASAGAALLVRPDGHVAARWQVLTVPALDAALTRLFGRTA